MDIIGSSASVSVLIVPTTSYSSPGLEGANAGSSDFSAGTTDPGSVSVDALTNENLAAGKSAGPTDQDIEVPTSTYPATGSVRSDPPHIIQPL